MNLPPDLQLQQDVAARLQVDAVLSPFGVIQEAEGNTEADVAAALGPIRAGGLAQKLAGTLINVLITEDGRDERVNIPGPQEDFLLTVRVYEVPKMAQAAAKAANLAYLPYPVLCQRVKQLLHQWQLGTAPVLYQRATPYNDGKGTIGKDVLFSWKPAPIFVPMAARPILAKQGDGSLVCLSNSPGVIVCATLDGSLPTPAAPLVSAPGAPLAVPAPAAGVLVRAAAYPPPDANSLALLPSGVSEMTF